jgi:[acyl-carrier-protein] S-malonyltransferase
MAATALLFPGQGSQRPDMRAVVERACDGLAERAEQLVGADPFERAADGTRFLQPAVFCTSIALWTARGRPVADAVAGHSLGEYAALVAAGSLTLADALELVVVRGRAMAAAADAAPSPGAMVAVAVGPHDARALAERYGLVVANDNATEQLVLSGPWDAVQRLRAQERRRGLRCAILPVSGALHSPAMAPAVDELARALARVEIRPPRVPVFSGASAQPFDDVRARLVEGVTAPVRWREILLALRSLGIQRFIDVGPGEVLAGLVRRTLADAVVVAGEAADQLPLATAGAAHA